MCVCVYKNLKIFLIKYLLSFNETVAEVHCIFLHNQKTKKNNKNK